MDCVQVNLSMSRYYPRPSRTGRRIELGRQLHGSTIYPDADEGDDSGLDSSHDLQTQRELSWPRIYLRLIKVFFCYTHAHFPFVVYERLAHAFNLAYGDFRLMAQYLNGTEADKEHPVICGGPTQMHIRQGSGNVECTPETLEVLFAVILAWAAHHIHLPFEALDPAIFTQMGHSSLVDAILADPELGYKRTAPVEVRSSADENTAGGPKRRVKRRQGVACDTCRLRRVRCDLMEQPAGSKACSRCRVKRIVCTDRYIQWKQQRDMQRRPAGGTGDTRTLPVAVTCVQLLPEIHEFEFDEQLPPATLGLSQQELLEYGMVRENVCNILINRALLLVHKYDLQHTCNTQSAQVLGLLASLLDYSRPEMAYDAQRAAVLHMSRLFPCIHIDLSGIEQSAEAEARMKDVFSARSQLTLWVRDAIFNVSHQRRPQLSAHWFMVGIRAPDAPDAQDDGLRPLNLDDIKGYMREDLPESTALCLIFCSTTHLGSIAHHLFRDVMAPLSEQLSLPSLAQVETIATACHAIWDDLYTVEQSHRLFTSRARLRLPQLRAISVLHWTTMVYCLIFVPYHALSRRLRDWFVTNNSHLARGSSSGEERTRVLEAMRRLFQESQEKTLCYCRVIAYLARNQLSTGLIHRASSLTRQLFRVAQYLARSPAVDGTAESEQDSEAYRPDSHSVASVDFLLNPPEGHKPEILPAPSPHDTTTSIIYPDLALSVPLSRHLAPYTREAKRREVDWCIEALGQIGYAFPGLDTEIRRIVDIVQAMS